MWREPSNCRLLGILLATGVLSLLACTTREASAQEGGGSTLLITDLGDSPWGPQIFRVNADGSGRKPVHSGFDPALSPDGKRIAYVSEIRDEKIGGLYAMNLDGSGRRRLAEEAREILALAPSWSPDGKRIAFCTVVPDHKRWITDPHLYVVDADGQNLKRLGKVEGLSPAWSPDGRRLLFTRVEEKAWSLCVMDATGANVRELVRNGLMGAWSPDGQSLAYVVLQQEESAGLYVARADGTKPRRLAVGQNTEAYGPQWSRDGKRLFFTRVMSDEGPPGHPTKHTAVYVIGSDGRNLRRLTKGDGPESLGGTSLFTDR